MLNEQQLINAMVAAMQAAGIEVTNDSGNPLSIATPSGQPIDVNQGQSTQDDIVTTLKPIVVVQNFSKVNQSASNTTIIEANSSRMALSIVNDSGDELLIKYGNTASPDSFTYAIASGQNWDMPTQNGVYTGHIDGIWRDAGAGSAKVTELV